MSNERDKEYFPGLDGIRGVAFLLVFVSHYTMIYDRPKRLGYYPFYLLMNTMWFLVPIFFVLSGFLITRILLGTRDRIGYFKGFYFRRALRILPLYYATLAAVGAVMVLRHRVPLGPQWLYLFFLQNFSSVAMNGKFYPPGIWLTHLWSVAIEEQFYLLWPLAIWACRSEKSLLRLIYTVIALSFTVRFGWPLFHLPSASAYFNTATRMDAIMLGALLAIEYSRQTHWHALVRASRIAIPVLWAVVVLATVLRGHGLTDDFFGVSVLVPVMNLIGAACVVLAIQPGLVQRVCSGKHVRWLGSMTYGLYLFHGIYTPLFTNSLLWRLARYLPYDVADGLVLCSGFAFTLLLAMLANRFIERPAQRWRAAVRYGTKVERHYIAAPPETGPLGGQVAEFDALN